MFRIANWCIKMGFGMAKISSFTSSLFTNKQKLEKKKLICRHVSFVATKLASHWQLSRLWLTILLDMTHRTHPLQIKAIAQKTYMRQTKKKKNYLPHRIDIVTSLRLGDSRAVDASSFVTLMWKYAGWLGLGSVIFSLLSITTTSDIVGRSAAFSWTHSNAMLMHLIIWNACNSVDNEASKSSTHLSSFHNCHAFK